MTHRPRKRFGQNFLQDTAVIRQILDAVQPAPGEHLLEIGPGRGALTAGLLTAAGRLDAVELDRDLIPPLIRTCSHLGELHIHNADILKFDVCTLARSEGRLRIVGNLPYNISTPLLFHLLDQADCIEDMHLMLQKEVVDRMSAVPGNRTYGRLTVMLGARAEVTPLFDIGPGSFRPAPKVVSSFVRLSPHREPPVQMKDFALFSRVVTQAFSHRRKTLRNALRGLVSSEAMRNLGIDPGSRAEQLGLEEFANLAGVACKNGSPT